MKGLIFTYALTYGGAAVALFNPYVGLLIYVCFSIAKPELLWLVPPGNYSRIIAISLLCGWALQGFGNWSFGRGKHLIVLLLGFHLWSVVSASIAPFPDVAWPHIESMTKIVIPCLVGATLIDSREKLRQLAWVITLSAGYWAFRENEIYLLGQFYGLGDNQKAHTFAVGAGVAFFVGLTESRLTLKLLAFLCAALQFHAVLFHMSRGGMIGAVVIGAVLVWLIPKDPKTVKWILLAVLAGAMMAGPSIRAEFSTVFESKEQRDWSAQSRIELWLSMLDLAAKNPVLGVGPQNWPMHAHLYDWTKGKQGHGLWIQAIAETGIPGGIMYFSFFACCAFSLWRHVCRARHAVDPFLHFYAIMVVATMCGWIVEAQFGSFYGIELPYYLVALGVGIHRVAAKEATASSLMPEVVCGCEECQDVARFRLDYDANAGIA